MKIKTCLIEERFDLSPMNANEKKKIKSIRKNLHVEIKKKHSQTLG